MRGFDGALLDEKVSPFDPPQVVQSLKQRGYCTGAYLRAAGGGQDPQRRELLRRLLRMGDDPRDEEAANDHAYKRPPVHH
ncbi:MAG TPA: hypothetical protein VKJ00_14640 [Thermoanaerobaculia bacterium]|nr:hypothetical protein [Thermoanaerobaculia bacterium]